MLRPVLVESVIWRAYSQFMRSYHPKGAVGKVSRPVHRSLDEKGLRNSDKIRTSSRRRKEVVRYRLGRQSFVFFVSPAP